MVGVRVCLEVSSQQRVPFGLVVWEVNGYEFEKRGNRFFACREVGGVEEEKKVEA